MPKTTADKLTAQLAKGKLCPVYLLTGEDVYRKNLVIEQIRKAVNPDDFNFFQEYTEKADISEVLSLVNTPPVFADKRLVVLLGIEKLRKEPKEALLRYLESPLDTTILVLTHNDNKKMKTEKTLAQYGADAGVVCNFDELKNDDLSSWVRAQALEKKMELSFDAVDMLCNLVGSDLGALENELEKLALYVLDRADKTISQADVLACVGFSKEQNPFELANAITACQKDRALKLVDKLLEDGEEPIAVLAKMTYPIEKMARIKRLVQGGMSAGEVAKAAGLMFWESRLVSSSYKFPSVKTFEQTLNRIIEADACFKSSSASDPKLVLKGILFTLFR